MWRSVFNNKNLIEFFEHNYRFTLMRICDLLPPENKKTNISLEELGVGDIKRMASLLICFDQKEKTLWEDVCSYLMAYRQWLNNMIRARTHTTSVFDFPEYLSRQLRSLIRRFKERCECGKVRQESCKCFEGDNNFLSAVEKLSLYNSRLVNEAFDEICKKSGEIPSEIAMKLKLNELAQSRPLSTVNDRLFSKQGYLVNAGVNFDNKQIV